MSNEVLRAESSLTFVRDDDLELVLVDREVAIKTREVREAETSLIQRIEEALLVASDDGLGEGVRLQILHAFVNWYESTPNHPDLGRGYSDLSRGYSRDQLTSEDHDVQLLI